MNSEERKSRHPNCNKFDFIRNNSNNYPFDLFNYLSLLKLFQKIILYSDHNWHNYCLGTDAFSGWGLGGRV